jgi:type IV pilus assembly protein PilV
MTKREPAGRLRNQAGVMLIEALIGMLIFSIGILALMGMQAVAMRNTVDSKYRTEASYLANEVIGQMWTDRGNLVSYTTPLQCPLKVECAAWFARVQATLPNATGADVPTIEVAGQTVTVTVYWRRPGEAGRSNHVAVATINNS